MSIETKEISSKPLPQATATATTSPPAHEGFARTFWRALTRFDSSKLSPYMALRNSIGVVLPLIVGFALNMPRGGLVMASGALNVAYSDGSDPYPQRAKRMLSSSVLCAVGVLCGALSGNHNVAAVIIATLWAFAAGMFVAAGDPPTPPSAVHLGIFFYSLSPPPPTPPTPRFSPPPPFSGRAPKGP